MTRSFRSRLTLAATAVALFAAGAVVAAQAFSGASATSSAIPAVAGETKASDAAAVTMHDWTETGPRHGSIINP
jgi:hypothetical protein